MQDLNGWNEEDEVQPQMKWEVVKKSGEAKWNVENYTCETRQRARAHTHIFNANSSTTGRNTEVFEDVCVLIRIQLHTKLPLHQQRTKGSLNY